MAWDDDKRAEVVAQYEGADPTPETSMEIVKEIADSVGESPNGVRMILTKAGVYIKKDTTKEIKKLIVARDKPNNLNSISLQFGILLLKLSKSFVLSKLSIEFEAQLDDSFNKPNSIPE